MWTPRDENTKKAVIWVTTKPYVPFLNTISCLISKGCVHKVLHWASVFTFSYDNLTSAAN